MMALVVHSRLDDTTVATIDAIWWEWRALVDHVDIDGDDVEVEVGTKSSGGCNSDVCL